MLRDKILSESYLIQSQIKQLQFELKNLPEGKLLISNDGKYKKWYVSNGHTKNYIPKKNRFFAEQLAQKKYLMTKLEELLREKQALDAYLQIQNTNEPYSDATIPPDSEYAQLLASYFKPVSDDMRRWTNEEYERNQSYPEYLVHKASSGIRVRSKSEAMIERFLYTNRIPFRYECALHLDSMIFYPDFTILHPKTKDTVYWEHFGRMDDIAYAEKTFSKLRTYATYGIIPSIHLITTYETKKHPLNYDDVEKIGSLYLL